MGKKFLIRETDKFRMEANRLHNTEATGLGVSIINDIIDQAHSGPVIPETAADMAGLMQRNTNITDSVLEMAARKVLKERSRPNVEQDVATVMRTFERAAEAVQQRGSAPSR